MFIKGFPYVYIFYTVSNTICTNLVARYKYSHLVIGSAQYFGTTFIAELPKSHALSKCIVIPAPCLSRVYLICVYFTQCTPPFVHISSPVINIPTLRSVPPRILIPLSSRNQLKNNASTTDPMFIRVSPLLVYLHPLYLNIRQFESPVLRCSDTVYVRHCRDATWWKIHLRPHVYKGFPFISLFTPPIFP